MTRRAMVSVTDKTGLEKLKLLGGDWEFVSTGGTLVALRELGIPCIKVEHVTGFPLDLAGGRVKTLHHGIFAGILVDRSKPEYVAGVLEAGFDLFDLVVVNLYDFAGQPEIDRIDVGGPSLLRAAAKNFESVVVLADPADYDPVINLLATTGEVPHEMRKWLAAKVFEITSRYDREIAAWFLA